MVPSVSPIMFFETHRYVAISLDVTAFIVNFIKILYALAVNSILYLIPEKSEKRNTGMKIK